MRIGVCDPAPVKHLEKLHHLRLRVRSFEPAVLQPDGVSVMVEGMRVGIAGRDVGEVDETGRDCHHEEGADAERQTKTAHGSSRSRRTTAAA